MHLHLSILLALAICFSSDASATAATNARPTMVQLNNAPTQRLLRSDTTARIDDNDNDNDEEERAWYDGLAKLIKPNTKMLTKLERENPALAKLAKQKDLTQAFKSLKVTKFQNVDDLFTSAKYEQWIGYMIHWNSQSKNEPFTVAKMFNDQLGSKKSFEMFAVAAKSANPNVEQMGKSYQIQLFKLFQKAENTPGQISTSLGGDAAAAKMFITVMQSTSKSDRKLGMKFANGFLKQWKEAGKTPAQLEQIAPTFLKTYATLLRATEKSAIKANPIRAAAAAAARV